MASPRSPVSARASPSSPCSWDNESKRSWRCIVANDDETAMAFMNKRCTASATEPVDEAGPAAQKMLAERESEVCAVKTKRAKTSHNIPAALPGTVCQQRPAVWHARRRSKGKTDRVVGAAKR